MWWTRFLSTKYCPVPVISAATWQTSKLMILTSRECFYYQYTFVLWVSGAWRGEQVPREWQAGPLLGSKTFIHPTLSSPTFIHPTYVHLDIHLPINSSITTFIHLDIYPQRNSSTLTFNHPKIFKEKLKNSIPRTLYNINMGMAMKSELFFFCYYR